MAITAVRNGSCSMGAMAPEDFLELEAGEDDDELEVGAVMLTVDEAGKSSQRTKVMKSWREDTYDIPVFEVLGQLAGP